MARAKCWYDGCDGIPALGDLHCARHLERGAKDAAAFMQLSGRTALVCPHCQTQGTVAATPRTVKRGISGGKATGAVLTLGWSMLVTGLSRKQTVTEMHCRNCGMRWMV